MTNTFAHKGIQAAFGELGRASKNYFSQSSSLFYKPLIREALDDITKTVVKKTPEFFMIPVS